MAISIKDVRFTSRRSGSGPPTIYPRLLRDRSILPKVDIAIQYFESMVGRERREFEPEVLVHFFGDHKLARCVVACLARAYRYRSPEFEEIVTGKALERLERSGISAPRALRLGLYDRLNDFGHGFLYGRDRHVFLDRMEAQFGLRNGELERLLYLDAEEHAILTRIGSEPKPLDVVAQYNFGVLETLLRHAERIELDLAGWIPETANAARRLCSWNDVDAQVSQQGSMIRLRLVGRQDALGVWARHGRRVSRTVVQLLERARPLVVDGLATVALRDRRASLRLTPEVVDLLGGAATPCTGWNDFEAEAHEALSEAAGAMRGTGSGWSVRRLPEPQAWSAGVVIPDLMVRAGGQGFYVTAVRSVAHGTRLAPIARAAKTGEPHMFVGQHAAIAPLEAVGAHTVAIAQFEPVLLAQALRESLGALLTVGPRLDLVKESLEAAASGAFRVVAAAEPAPAGARRAKPLFRPTEERRVGGMHA
jgi:predicted nuclease of restriction endonuclease-like RecB superfamily